MESEKICVAQCLANSCDPQKDRHLLLEWSWFHGMVAVTSELGESTNWQIIIIIHINMHILLSWDNLNLDQRKT